MRFFHLSDLHIGLKLYNRDMIDDQRFILNEIIQTAAQRRPDAIVIAGDIYDRALPSAEAVELFDSFLTGLVHALPDCTIMIISGNHDSPTRINLYRDILSDERIYMIGVPPMEKEEQIFRVQLMDEFGPVNFFLLPFVRPSMVRAIVGPDKKGNNCSYDESLRRLLAREEIDESERNVLVSHQFYLPKGTEANAVERMESEIVTVGNIDQVGADVLSPFDYAALGHIHKPMRIGSEFYRYCGTPLACSFGEADQQKAILEVKLGAKGTVAVEPLPLVPLRRMRVIAGTAEEVLGNATDDYVRVELKGPAGTGEIDLQEMLRSAFPNLLEIRREIPFSADYSAGARAISGDETDPYSLCKAFLPEETDEEELTLLRDIINHVKGA
jgi:exonuclease SbcD